MLKNSIEIRMKEIRRNTMSARIDYQNRTILLFVLLLSLFYTTTLSSCAGTPSKLDFPVLHCVPVDASELQCRIKGTWDGIESVSNSEVSGCFEMEIMPDGRITGSYSGVVSGTISGCVDSSGKFQARGICSGLTISWSGSFMKSEATIRGSGEWSARSFGSGTWSGQRYDSR